VGFKFCPFCFSITDDRFLGQIKIFGALYVRKNAWAMLNYSVTKEHVVSSRKELKGNYYYLLVWLSGISFKFVVSNVVANLHVGKPGNQ